MRSAWRSLGRSIAVITIAALAFCAFVYFSNARLLARSYPVAQVTLPVASSPDAAQRGKALADVTGCTDCHRPDLRGGVFEDGGWLHGTYYAANLTLKAQQYSDGDLARIVRLGVRPDGRGVIAMPAMGYVRLTDTEMADIIAFLRSLPPGGVEQPAHFIGPLDQWDLWRGQAFKTAASYVDGERRKEPPDAGPEHAAARHLVGIVCAECHGGDLKGNGWDSGAPDLAVILAYGVPEFTRLLRTGIAADGKERGLMTGVARSRLHNLTDQQIGDIHAYLTARAKPAS
jgi:mono/diheme cytochrome c family protein